MPYLSPNDTPIHATIVIVHIPAAVLQDWSVCQIFAKGNVDDSVVNRNCPIEPVDQVGRSSNLRKGIRTSERSMRLVQ